MIFLVSRIFREGIQVMEKQLYFPTKSLNRDRAGKALQPSLSHTTVLSGPYTAVHIAFSGSA